VHAVLLLFVLRLLLVACAAGSFASRSTPSANPTVGPRSAPHAAPGTHEHEPMARSADFARSVHLVLGVPTDRDPSDDYWLDERSFALSYSALKREPNWVAWRLDRSYLGHVKRLNDFRPDRSLPADLYHVTASDYLHSGYDRGHMCPSADREDSREDNSRTFLFTNMEPQLHELNAGPWEKLEEYERGRAERGELLYIVAGGVFSAPFPTIGNGVAVPAANFKIIVVLQAEQAAAAVGPGTEVIAVLMPNEAGVGAHEWTDYLTSVDALERATGYDFLNAIPEPVQRVIEARTARP
jgi:endonuclease G